MKVIIHDEGREMIEHTKKLVEENFTVEGYNQKAEVYDLILFFLLI